MGVKACKRKALMRYTHCVVCYEEYTHCVVCNEERSAIDTLFLILFLTPTLLLGKIHVDTTLEIDLI